MFTIGMNVSIGEEHMSKPKLWILVEVRSGIPTGVQIFSDEQSAQSRERELRKNLNLENDETGIFYVRPEIIEAGD
jgi:hypothetical protein